MVMVPVIRTSTGACCLVSLIAVSLVIACGDGGGPSVPQDLPPDLSLSGDSVATAGSPYVLRYRATDDSGLRFIVIDWDEGGARDTIITSNARSAEGTRSHVYTDAATRRIGGEVSDNAGQSAADTLPVRIRSDADSGKVALTLDASTTFQTMDGWGMSLPAPVSMVFGVNPLASFPFQTGEDDPLYRLLFDEQAGLGLNLITLYQWWDFDGSWSGAVRPTYEETNDDDDPNHINWAGFELSSRWPNFGVARRAQQLGARLKLTVGGVPGWMATSDEAVNPAMGDEFAEYLSAFILFARDSLGLDIAYLSIMNEPNNKGRLSATAHATLLNRVAAMLDGKGLSTKLVAPEAVSINGAVAYTQRFLGDATTLARLGAISTHPYGGDTPENWSSLFTLADGAGLGVWQTEFSTAPSGTGGTSYTIEDALRLAQDIRRHLVQGNVSAWFNFLGVGCDCGTDGGAGGALIVFRPSGGSSFEYLLPPRYYAFGQFSRYVRPGARRIGVTPDEEAVQPVAFRTTSGNIVLILINPRSEGAEVSVAGWGGASEVSVTRTSATEQGADLGSFAVEGGSVMLSVPPKSVTTVIGNNL